MHRYKSWLGLKKQLEGRICAPLKGRVAYFLTSYSDVHNAYSRAAIRVDGIERAAFTWYDGYRQEADVYDDPAPSIGSLERRWNTEGIRSAHDFLNAATAFLQLPIAEALKSEDMIVRVLAILDGRVGRRTLEAIRQSDEMDALPEWVRWFYELRLAAAGS